MVKGFIEKAISPFYVVGELEWLEWPVSME